MNEAIGLFLICLSAPPSELQRFPNNRAYAHAQAEIAYKEYRHWSEIACIEFHYAAGGVEEIRVGSPRLCCSPQKRREVEIAIERRRVWLAWCYLNQSLLCPTESNLDALREGLTPEEWAAGQMPLVLGH